MQRITISLFLAVLFFSCENIKSYRTIKLAHGLDTSHSVHKAMVKMGEEMERLSEGKLKLDIYPNQQLGTERESLELLQIGGLDMTKVSAGVMENFAPKMKIFGVPFLFKNKNHAFRFLDGPRGKDLLAESEHLLLKGMAYYDAGSRSFYTKEKPVMKPADLEGLKIRVMESVTAMDMVNTLGGSPTPISWGELYTSLQQGVVDGAENNPPSFYLSRHYEVCKYYSLDEHTVLPDVLVLSTHTWKKLTDQEKGWMTEAIKTSVTYQRGLWAEAEEKALAEVQKAGVVISRPNKNEFSNKVKAIYDKYKNQPEMFELIKQIQETE